MPEFILNRNHVHRSLSGHIINFVAGEPVYVPPVCVKEIAGIGGELVTGEKVDLLDPETQPPVELTVEERRAALIAAFQLLEERNNRDDFTGQGIPSVTAVKRLVEFAVDKKELETVWREYQESKAA